MNIYIRYFQQEALVKSIDEVVDFLSSISEINVTDALVAEVQDYLVSNNNYPKRYKVRQRIYFILIKTIAETLEEFKNNNKQQGCDDESNAITYKEIKSTLLNTIQFGWYKGSIHFKRVTPIADTNKFQYNDTTFSALLRAESPINCYQQLIDYLSNRQDIDPRSQFPSAKGSNFDYQFLGEEIPENFSA